ncbi:MAG: serine/threonine protein kinase, partial [Clostridia bacterium]|nr:serine/threonine protein kinase [Clostridia bacterium]
MSHPRYQPGTTIAGHYTVTGILGSGGTANVYLARDTVMNRTVAVKVLSGEITPTASRNFMTEARAAAVLSHPNIVNVYDVLEVSGEMYIIMEYVCGITLRDYLNYHGHLSVKESANCANQILHALHAAHSRGIVHRDIKPGNILITTEGRIKVTDFGIARLPDRDSFLMPDRTVGTVQYVSPEQAGGGAVDERSDLYSLGVLMYEMLTGSVPFEAERPADVAMMHLSKKPEPPTLRNPSIPGAMEKIVLCALEKDPAARFDGAADMLRVLDRLPDDLLTGHARPLREEGSAYRLATERPDEHTAPIPKARFRRRYLPEDPTTDEIEVVAKPTAEPTAPPPAATVPVPPQEAAPTPPLRRVETPPAAPMAEGADAPPRDAAEPPR